MLFSRQDLFRLIIPMMAQQVLNISLGTINSIMVASAGEATVSGVSLVGTLDALLMIAFTSLVIGGSVTVSHELGGGNKAFARACAKELTYVSCAIALALAVVVGVFCRPLLEMLFGSAEEAVLQSAESYLGIMVISFPFLAVYTSGATICRTGGDTVTGLWLSLAANVINVASNIVLIYVFHLGAAGAALSTLLARFVCAVLVMIKLTRRKGDLYIERLFHYRPNRDVIRKMLRIGVPHGIENSMFQVGRLATQVLISGMGTAAIAANSVANTLANYLYLASNAISDSAITVVGRCYGAGEHQQAKKYARTLLWWTYLCMWVVSALLFVLAKPIIGVYQLSAEGSKIALELTLFHCLITCLVRPPAFTLPSVFKATGDTRFTMIVSPLSMWTLRVGGSYLLCLESVNIFGLIIPGFNMGIMGVWVAMGCDWVLRTTLYTIRFMKNTWLKQEKGSVRA